MTVTFDVWRMPRTALPRVLWLMARERGRLRRTPAVDFVKLLGTGGFGPATANAGRWAAITTWAGPPAPLHRFDALAARHCRLTLSPLASRGTWAGR